MRERKRIAVFSFYTTTAAFATEKYCKTRGIPGRMIPVPREMSAGCGISWCMQTEDFRSFAKSGGTEPEKSFSELADSWKARLKKHEIEVEDIAEIIR